MVFLSTCQLFFDRRKIISYKIFLDIQIQCFISFRKKMDKNMDKVTIGDVYITQMPSNSPVKPCRFYYSLDGKRRNEDIVEDDDSVLVIVFNVTRKVVVMIRHFRAGEFR